MTPEVVWTHPDRCGEGPLWDWCESRLLWTDIPANVVCSLDPATGRVERLVEGVNVSAIALHEGGGLVLAGECGLHLFHNGRVRPLLERWCDEPLTCNDILAGPHGRLYAGTLHWGEEMERPGRLYLLHGTTIEIVEEGLELANGVALSPDDTVLYLADSALRRIYAYDVAPATGRLSNRRTLGTLTTEEGLPDGLTCDAEGHVWCACWYGGRVLRFDPDGRRERAVPLPVAQVSSLAFGGPDLADLYVTTAADPWPSRLAPPTWDPLAPQGGSLYRVPSPARGRREHRADLIGLDE